MNTQNQHLFLRKDERIIMGKNCLREVLKHFPERIKKVYTTKTNEKHDELFNIIQENNITTKTVSKEKLFDLVHTDSHQSYVAIVKAKPIIDINTFLKHTKDKSFVLMLDSIYDPQNLGAILRAAECLGVDAVIWSKNRGSDITPVVTKAGVGASELVDIIKVSNLVESIKKFKEHGFHIITAEVKNAQPIYSFDFPSKTLLIVGSEGKGIQKLISKQSDSKVFIPMQGNIDSLNVSQATAIFLFYNMLKRTI